MIIYIIIKLMLSYWLVFKKKWIKVERLGMIMDIIIVIIFFYLWWKSVMNIETTYKVFIIGVIILSWFLLYRGINIILKNFEKIIKWVESKEKIKKILLNPKMNKIIYYSVWGLPWNIMYWVYFWVMENGWYVRVWYCSNRDIFFMKYLKWDSRRFFYKVNEGIKKYGWGII